jgi:LysR family carnitine catabolism transcriptional activator
LLAVETLMEDQLVLACPIGHPLARARQVTWRELPPHPLIGFGRDNALQMLVNSAADAAGIALRVACEVSSISTAVALVEAGLGISVLPSYIRTTGRPHKLHFRPLVDPAVTRGLSLMSLRDRAMPPAAQTFMELLRLEMGRRAADRNSPAAP